MNFKMCTEAVNVKKTSPLFIALELKYPEKHTRHLSVRIKMLGRVAGNVRNATHLRNGTLTAGIFSGDQTETPP
jgi:hypothetical protein